MNIKTLITTAAILGSSTAAMASPHWSGSASGTVSLGYSSPRQPVYQPSYEPVHQPVYQPTYQPSYQPRANQVVVRDHRSDSRPIYNPRPVYVAQDGYQDDDWNTNQDWNHTSGPRAVLLASSLNYGNTDFRKDIVPGALAGRFGALQLAGESGSTFIEKVVVEFVDGGAPQQIDLGATLRRGQVMNLDLAGNQARALKRILVYRADRLINEPSSGEFSVFAL